MLPEEEFVLVGSLEATLLVLLIVVLFGPIITERFRIPGLIGLIVGGIIFGPFVIGWLEADGLVSQLGGIGILYLMFLAGVSFNLRGFMDNRTMAITYGLLGFFVPFILSIVVVLSMFEVGILSAALIGAMWASNTLVAYPDVQAAGLADNRAVSASVSAGVVADLLSLTVLAVATATTIIDLEPTLNIDIDIDLGFIDDVAPLIPEPTVEDPLLPLWIGLPLLAAFCLWALPRIGDWFFVRVGRSRTQRFVFALVGMSAGATVALLGGIEGLIGAFLAGLGMNRLVPTKGSLMDRIEFVGSSIFIPAFLVSIGLSIDPVVLFDPETIVLGLLFTALVLVGKSTAAILAGVRYGFDWNEIGLMSSLSFGQAASTLAIAQVGISLGMFGQVVVNAAVLTIVATALITSYGTRFFLKRIPRPPAIDAPVGERVLLDVRPHGSDMHALMNLAAAIVRPDDGLVVPYAVPAPGNRASAQAIVDAAVRAAEAHGLDTDGVVRIDDSFADATINLAEETDASMVVLAWQGPKFASDYVFGNDIDSIGERSPVPTVAVRIKRPWTRVVAVLGDPGASWQREDAELVVSIVQRLARPEAGEEVVVVGSDASLVPDSIASSPSIHMVTDQAGRSSAIESAGPDDLLIAPAYVLHDLTPRAGWRIARALADANVAVVAGPRRLVVARGSRRRPMTSTLP